MTWKFGKIKIQGEKYKHDVYIHVDGSVTKRNKDLSRHLKEEYGQTPLTDAELHFLRDEEPEVVYIDIGFCGQLPITYGAKRILDGFDVIMMPTTDDLKKALKKEKRKYAAVIHVTC
ncbi:hypothetical protein ABH15_00465 [Methanoculleus taiwanensis]|uniref:Uncharacterized protein n=1 Tax=Methanoculleus taiwanensis TaxID=1550565 RepID=A0A498H494_9EURY|nr:hypothetical protein [Methanoculleus taiwanensis]RXE56694.1 hypothetical protein ABH15_00465 [Methanoculleus taiwanensis]